MMKFCCLIVIILCTIGVSTGGRLTTNYVASNGTCGRKGVTCDAAFGEGWIEKGKCCNGGPCCKFTAPMDHLVLMVQRVYTGEQGPHGPSGFPDQTGPSSLSGPRGQSGPTGEIGHTGPEGPRAEYGDTGDQGNTGLRGESRSKGPPGPTGPKGDTCPPGPSAPCVPCPEGYDLLDDQTVSTNCFYYSTTTEDTWDDAQKICSSTDGAYLWRPNSEDEASAVRDKFTIPMDKDVWTGANDLDEDDTFKFVIDSSSFSFDNLPFGKAKNVDAQDLCVSIRLETATPPFWRLVKDDCNDNRSFVCEVSPTTTCPVP